MHTMLHIVTLIYYIVITISYVRELFAEAFIVIFRVKYSMIPVSIENPAYSRICKQATLRPGRVIVDKNGIQYPYGVFVALQYRCIGYITNDINSRMFMHIWTFGNKNTVAKLMSNDCKYTVAVANITLSTTYNDTAMIRVPRTPRAWQLDAINVIRRVYMRVPDDAIVCLITGPPNCGKSTIPLLLMREFEIPSHELIRYMQVQCISRLSQVLGVVKSMHMLDEIDEVMRDITNNKHAANTTKSLWNTCLDHVHMLDVGPIVIMTTNNTYDELCSLAGEHAESMMRPGRIDVILHVNEHNELIVQRERM